MKERLYRKAMLDKLSSPEQLDDLVVVSSPSNWAQLLGLALLVSLCVTWTFLGTVPTRVYGSGLLLSSAGVTDIASTHDGQIDRFLVQEGQTLKLGEPVAILHQTDDDTQTPITIASVHEGHVLEVYHGPGDVVGTGEHLLRLALAAPSEDPLEGLIYVDAHIGKRVEEGMSVHVSPSTYASEEVGVMIGTVRSVADFPSSLEAMERRVGNRELAHAFQREAEGFPLEIHVQLKPSAASANGYQWTSPSGEGVHITEGTPLSAGILLETRRPIELLFPFLAVDE